MTTAFDRSMVRLLQVEGGFGNLVNDRGGATRFGITERVARAYGYGGDMRNLPVDLATRIYREQYWAPLKLEEISHLSERVADEMFDQAVNTGVATVGRFLQRALNALNRDGADYQDVEVDGFVGAVTVRALGAYLALRGANGEQVLLRALNCLQGARYLELAEWDRSQEAFLFGWLRARVS